MYRAVTEIMYFTTRVHSGGIVLFPMGMGDGGWRMGVSFLGEGRQPVVGRTWATTRYRRDRPNLNTLPTYSARWGGGWWVTVLPFSSTNPLSLSTTVLQNEERRNQNISTSSTTVLTKHTSHHTSNKFPRNVISSSAPSTPPEYDTTTTTTTIIFPFSAPPPSSSPLPPPFHSNLPAAHSIIMALEQGQDTCLAHLPLPPITHKHSTAWSGRLSHASLRRP